MPEMNAEMIVFTTIVGLFGIVGGICGLWSLIYVRQQTAMLADQKKRDMEDDLWAQRFERLKRTLVRINPLLQVHEPGQKNPTCIYVTMYPDPKLRLNIENFIVRTNGPGSAFLPRTPEPYEFRSPVMRETIQRAETEMDKFIKEHPFCKQHLSASD